MWIDGEQYERYMGRWSRLVAREFVDWLGVSGATWLDVGCGTGALSETILDHARPREVVAIDRSADYVAAASGRLANRAFRARVADATALPFEDASVDIAVSGLVLNFVPQPERAIAEMARVARTHVAFYLWDYAGEMQFLRRFWDAAIALDPAARELDEGVRFPLCAPDRMRALVAGLREIEARAIVIPTSFRDFDDLWEPFTGGQGPAPSYVAALEPAHRDRLRDAMRAMPLASTARAWAIRARS
jgi:SAM-dependent methyltransferase